MPRLTARIRAPWGASQRQDSRLVGELPAALALDMDRVARWPAPQSLDTRQVGAWGVSAAVDGVAVVPWGVFGPATRRALVSRWGIATPADDAAVLPWGQFTRHDQIDASGAWGISTPVDDAAVLPWGAYGPALASALALAIPASTPLGPWWVIPWGIGTRRIDHAVTSPTDFDDAPIPGLIVIPIQRSYIVANDVTLRRVADNFTLEALDMALSIDSDSWVWGFSATLRGSDLDEVVGAPGEPVELEASVNGYVFRLLAERVSRSRDFGQARVRISGRGIAAVLDAPYAPVLSLSSASAITAQQAATAAIQHVALPLGWSLDWQLTDWLLPAGLWTHQGSPISAVQRIASAAGGYIQADQESQELRVLPRYPLAPWDWAAATPDIEVPVDVCTTESIERQDKPAYNAVYLSGGILARVKRTGTAGDVTAQMITDDLITHADAARQRGTSILADTGAQTRQSITLPILETGGILLPGTLASIVDGATSRRGLVRGVSISTGTRVRQTVEIETHE